MNPLGDPTGLPIMQEGLEEASEPRRADGPARVLFFTAPPRPSTGFKESRVTLPAVAVSQSPEDKFREYLASRPRPQRFTLNELFSSPFFVCRPKEEFHEASPSRAA